MPTYIVLVNYTQQGIEAIKESPGRVDQVRGLMKSMGGAMPTIFLTMGRYDLVAITEAPNDEAAAKAALIIGKGGNVRTETMRAFTEEEMKTLVGSLD